MGLAFFVRGLAYEGRVVVGIPEEGSGLDLDGEIRDLDARLRAHAAGVPPPLDLAVARWAAAVLERACYYLKDRRSPPGQVSETLAGEPPGEVDARAMWSADLFFRCLPDLRGMAVRLPEGDALVLGLAALARRWPLSLGGAEGTVLESGEPVAQAVIDGHPCLRRLQADRRAGRQQHRGIANSSTS